MTVKELFTQLKDINASCREALQDEDFQKVKILLQLKRELFQMLRDVTFSPEDLPLVREVLADEEALAGVAIQKKKELQGRLKKMAYH